MFRLLALYPDIELLRLVSALVMSVAVNGMHYTGMAAATFHYSDGLNNNFNSANRISQKETLEISIICKSYISVCVIYYSYS